MTAERWWLLIFTDLDRPRGERQWGCIVSAAGYGVQGVVAARARAVALAIEATNIAMIAQALEASDVPEAGLLDRRLSGVELDAVRMKIAKAGSPWLA